MKILICGDREWDNLSVIRKVVDGLPKGSTVIQGGCRGADRMAAALARGTGLRVEEYPADWKTYGKMAGPIRNSQMLDQEPIIVIAFHNDISKSKGTKNCVESAKKRGIKVKIITEDKHGNEDDKRWDLCSRGKKDKDEEED